MSTAATIRSQVEAALAGRIPSALTTPSQNYPSSNADRHPSVDEVLEGGLPVGTLTELVGGECSGRTSLALSFLAELTGAGKVCAWIDVSNGLNSRIRCGRRSGSYPAIVGPLRHACWNPVTVSCCEGLRVAREVFSCPLRSRKVFTEEASVSIHAVRPRESRVLLANC